MPDGHASRFNAVAYAASVERALDTTLMHSGGAAAARAGRRPGPGLEVTVGGTPEAATVAPGGGVIVDATGGGAYRFMIPAAVVKNLATRPGAGTSRIDLVIARIYDADAHVETALREVKIEIVTGTAGASPAVPALPAGSLRLAQLTVPSSGTVSVSKRAQRTAAAGGIVPVADATERDAIAPLYDGLTIFREDTSTIEIRAGGVWRPLALASDVLKIQRGEVIITVAGPAGDALVTFAEPFAAPPIIQLTVIEDDRYVPVGAAVTTTGFKAVAQHRTGAALSAGVRMHWTATW